MARGDLVAWHGYVGGGCGVFLHFLFLWGFNCETFRFGQMAKQTNMALQAAKRRPTTSTRTLATLDLLFNV